MEPRRLAVPFPIAGLDKSRGYQTSDPQTTPYAVNVVPDDAYEARVRGGSRRGTTKRFDENVGGPPQLLAAIERATSVSDEPVRHIATAYNGTVYVSAADLTAFAVSGGAVEYGFDHYLVAVSGALLAESGESITTESAEEIVLNGVEINPTRLSSAQRGGSLIIADYGDRVSGSDGHVTSNVLTAASVTDWASHNVDQNGDVVVIRPTAGSSVEQGTYGILSINAGQLTIDATLTNGGCTFEVAAGPKILDPDARTLSRMVATTGEIPVDARVVAVYRDRVVLAKDRIWFMSRQGDPYDWNYGGDAGDGGRAVAGTNAEAGQPAAPIIALVPGGDDYLVMFSEESTWVLRGDPAYGGQIDNLSRVVGCAGRFAWCYGPAGEVYFLSRDGLYVLPPGAAGIPQPLSRSRLPRELLNTDHYNRDVSLAYDSADQGIYIFVTPHTGNAGTHWWYDLATESFWNLAFSNNAKQPTMALGHAADPREAREVLIGCRDGYIRQFATQTTDDGDAISSAIVLGPFRISGDLELDGMIAEILGTLGEDTLGNVTVELYVGDDAEQAADAAILGSAPRHTLTWAAGRNRPSHPRIRGGAVCIRLESTSRWAFEALGVKVAALGRQRT